MDTRKPGQPPRKPAPAPAPPRRPTEVRPPTDTELYPIVRVGVPQELAQAPPAARAPAPPPPVARRRWPFIAATLLLLAAVLGAVWFWLPADRPRPVGPPPPPQAGTSAPAPKVAVKPKSHTEPKQKIAVEPIPSPEPKAGLEPPPPPKPAPSYGRLVVSVEPVGAVLWKDGKEVGIADKDTEFRFNELPREYALKVEKEGYRTIERKVTVEPDKTISIRLVAEPLPRLTWQALVAAAQEGKATAMLACFSREAQARIAETDKLLADNAKDLPDPLKGASFAAVLAAKVREAKAPVELTEEKVAGDTATLKVTWPTGPQVLHFLREDAAWKIGQPLPDLDRLKADAEAALRDGREAARIAEAKQDAEARAAAKKTLEDFWGAASAGNREALLACLDPAARKKAEDIDQRVMGLAKRLPTLAEKGLLQALGRRAREGRELGEPKIEGDRATLVATVGGGEDKVQLIKDAGRWKIALPFPEFDRLAEEAEKEYANLEAGAAKQALEDFWRAAKDGDREALLACLDPAARKKAEDLDQQAADLAKTNPALADLRLIPALAKTASQAPPIGNAGLADDGSKATLEAAVGTEKDKVHLVKDAAGWKIALPFPELDRLAKEIANARENPEAAELKRLEVALDKARAGTADDTDLPVLVRALRKTKDAALRKVPENAIKFVIHRVKDPEKCTPPLLKEWAGSDPPTRAVLLSLLGRVGGDKALDTVYAARKDANPEVAKAAVRSLADWPDPTAAPRLLDVAKEAADDADHSVAFGGYLRLVGQLRYRPPEERVKLYQDGMAVARGAEDKKAILAEVRGLPTLGALKLAQRLLKDAPVVNQAASATAKLAQSLAGIHRGETLAALREALGALKLTKRGLRDNAVVNEAVATTARLARSLAATHKDQVVAALREAIALATDLEIKRQAQSELDWILTPPFGTLKVSVLPKDQPFRVWLNRREMKVTGNDFELNRLAPGEHRLKVVMKGHSPVELPIAIAPNETRSVVVELKTTIDVYERRRFDD